MRLPLSCAGPACASVAGDWAVVPRGFAAPVDAGSGVPLQVVVPVVRVAGGRCSSSRGARRARLEVCSGGKIPCRGR